MEHRDFDRKSIELLKIHQKRKVKIACVQKTKWVGTTVGDADGYKLWYSRGVRGRNKVCILMERELRESILDVRRVNDRRMTIKIVV